MCLFHSLLYTHLRHVGAENVGTPDISLAKIAVSHCCAAVS